MTFRKIVLLTVCLGLLHSLDIVVFGLCEI